MVTGGLISGSVVADNTELYRDNAWATASELPFSRLVWAASAITFNDSVLVKKNE